MKSLNTLIIGFCILLISCQDSHHTKDPKYDLKNIGFVPIYNSIIVPKCLSCHDTAEKKNHYINLSTYETIMNSDVFPALIAPKSPEDSSFYDSVLQKDMPKNKPALSPVEIKAIYRWIKMGAPKYSELPGEHKDPREEPGEEPGDDNTGEPGDDDTGEPGDDDGTEEPGDDDDNSGEPSDDDEVDTGDPGDNNTPGEPEDDSTDNRKPDHKDKPGDHNEDNTTPPNEDIKILLGEPCDSKSFLGEPRVIKCKQ